jgi:hypothetical protein
MALPSSGTITMDMIRAELGVPSQSPFGLNEARSGTYVAINQCSTYKPPATGQVSLSDWYGYSQTQACPSTNAYVYVYNNYTNGSITNITVNGVSVDGISFPVIAGNTAAGSTTQVGSGQSIRVYYSSVSPSPSYAIVQGTDFIDACQLTAGTSNRIYTGVVVTGGGVVTVTTGAGNCP